MTAKPVKWLILLLIAFSSWGCESRVFDVEPEEEAPLLVPQIEGSWTGLYTGAEGMPDIRLDLTLELDGDRLGGVGHLRRGEEERLEVGGTFRFPELYVTMQGEVYDQRFILPGELKAEGKVIEGYFRGPGVDFPFRMQRADL